MPLKLIRIFQLMVFSLEIFPLKNYEIRVYFNFKNFHIEHFFLFCLDILLMLFLFKHQLTILSLFFFINYFFTYK